jgi:hypothetical protein
MSHLVSFALAQLGHFLSAVQEAPSFALAMAGIAALVLVRASRKR